jgi:hypothetical protein
MIKNKRLLGYFILVRSLFLLGTFKNNTLIIFLSNKILFYIAKILLGDIMILERRKKLWQESVF